MIFEKEFDKHSKSEDFSKNHQKITSETPDDLIKDLITPDRSEYRKRWIFKNGFGISVIRGFGTYGAKEGLFEIAVVDEGGLRYDTKITSDVIGHLTSEEVLELGERIMRLEWKERL